MRGSGFLLLPNTEKIPVNYSINISSGTEPIRGEIAVADVSARPNLALAVEHGASAYPPKLETEDGQTLEFYVLSSEAKALKSGSVSISLNELP